jgi:soluble lytic murein transglycosylase-like protein
MTPDDVKNICNSIGTKQSVDPKLLYAICEAESSLDPYACRYEEGYKYMADPTHWAMISGQSISTEIVQQKMSWGLMQVMGGLARELGFNGKMTMLCLPEIGIKYGAIQLTKLKFKYPDMKDQISSYNQGFPKKGPDGKYANKDYVSKVINYYQNG